MIWLPRKALQSNNLSYWKNMIEHSWMSQRYSHFKLMRIYLEKTLQHLWRLKLEINQKLGK